MNQLKMCFVGIGSIAKRHIRNLNMVANQNGTMLIIDAISRSGEKKKDEAFSYIRNVYSSIKELNDVYDAVFITNSTELHADTLVDMTPYGNNFFIEKPIASLGQLDKIKKYNCKAGSVYYVACPLRYNAVIQYIKDNIKAKDIISVQSVSSSYLPHWRPDQDYRSIYSAHRNLGGGVSIDLIHEWDYLTYLFGMPQKVKYMSGKKSHLEIDSEDYAIYIAEYTDKIVELHLDYFGRKTIRTITLFTADDTIVGDIANNSIRFLKSGMKIDFKENRDDYQKRELLHFIEMIDGKCGQDNDINHAVSVLRLTQGEI